MSINDILKIGTRIKQARKEKGLSQKEFATSIGIPYTTYSNYENNNRIPGKENLKKIAAALGVSESALLGIDPFQKAEQTVLFHQYLDSLGYDVFDNEGCDRFPLVLIENDHITPLTNEEFEDIQEAAKETIELKIARIKLNRMNDQ